MPSAPPSKPEVDVDTSPKQASDELRRRLKGINDLIKDIYGSRVRISELLAKQGIPPAQIERWKNDQTWLTRFLRRLQRELIQAWMDLMPGEDLRVLSRWYGVGKARNRSLQAIADEFGMTQSEAKRQLGRLQRIIREPRGQRVLEKAIMASVGKHAL